MSTLEHIQMDLLPEFEALFRKKNEDYGDTAADLGAAGQYADMHRKMRKLKRALWDGKPMVGEQPREILLDMIGHCFLSIAFLDAVDD